MSINREEVTSDNLIDNDVTSCELLPAGDGCRMDKVFSLNINFNMRNCRCHKCYEYKTFKFNVCGPKQRVILYINYAKCIGSSRKPFQTRFYRFNVSSPLTLSLNPALQIKDPRINVMLQYIIKYFRQPTSTFILLPLKAFHYD